MENADQRKLRIKTFSMQLVSLKNEQLCKKIVAVSMILVNTSINTQQDIFMQFIRFYKLVGILRDICEKKRFGEESIILFSAAFIVLQQRRILKWAVPLLVRWSFK